MFLSQSQLESAVLKRLEHLRSQQDGLALGMCQGVSNTLQASNSAAGVEWSSTDGHDEGQQDHIQVNLSDAALSAQLSAWEAWLATDGVIPKAQYYAATHALAQDILGRIIGGSSELPVSRTALDTAWVEDTDSSGSEGLSADRFKNALGALATTCSSDGTPQTAAACLATLLATLQGQQQRWQALVEQYDACEVQPAAASAAGDASAAGGSGGGDADIAVAVVPIDGDGDDNGDDLDALLGEDTADLGDVASGSDKSRAVAASAAILPGAEAAGPAVATGAAGAASADDEDETFSLGLSRTVSHALTDSSAAQDAAASSASPPPPLAARRGAAARAISVKSVEDPELRRTLSETSSANLDELPPNDLDAVMERQGSHAEASQRLARPIAASASGDVSLGQLAGMDLRSWAALKDKQQQPIGAQRSRPSPGSALAPLLGRATDACNPTMDQHLKGARTVGPRSPGSPGVAGPHSPPPPTAIVNGSSVRLSMERERGNGISRHGSNDSPQRPRSRSMGTNLSRKLSISEPGPTGPQAEWKHLPALGQASRLHPHHEMRQQSYGTGRVAAGPSRGRGGGSDSSTAAVAVVENKLPALPAMAGARGQPPKAMEFLRRPSMHQRSDGHHFESHQSGPCAHLPGLGPPSKPQGARALCVQSIKKSFRGDDYF